MNATVSDRERASVTLMHPFGRVTDTIHDRRPTGNDRADGRRGASVYERVAVGSGNPVKRRATAAVVGGTVTAVPVDSGVPEQPRGRAETVAGARTRAERALATERPDGGRYDLGVGIEGGVAPVDGLDARCLVMWAAVTDGEAVGCGAGPTLPLPPAVGERVREGAELGPVMDEIVGETGVARGRGAVGVLTDGRLDREAALADAVRVALAPLTSSRY